MKKSNFSPLLQETIHAFAEAAYEEKPHISAMLSPQAQKKKFEHEIEVEIQQMGERLIQGAKACIHGIIDESSKKKVIEQLQKAFNGMDDEAILEAGNKLTQDISWKEQFDLSKDCMELLYQSAKEYFEKNDVLHAEKAFFFLATLDPKEYAFWVGFGHACTQLNHYKEAINAYAMANILQPDNSWPHIWAGDVFVQHKDKSHARLAFEEALAVEEAKTSPDQTMIQAIQGKLQKVK